MEGTVNSFTTLNKQLGTKLKLYVIMLKTITKLSVFCELIQILVQ